ncbi:hypothetical protein FRB95_003264 [Tulasnella sp. JGI-2019a]|nr:hypothetical protein FRB95_003264 [Tulasnella sp. JGI-2019a]
MSRSGEALAEKAPRIHILLNSAGLLARNERALTKEGIVDTFATNHFGHSVWTEALLPSLKSAVAEPDSDVRIVTVASSAYKTSPEISKIESMDDIDVCKTSGPSNALKRYSTSKLCNVWFTRQLQKRLDQQNANILAICVDPGAVASPGAKSSLIGGAPWPLPLIIWPIIKMTFSTPAQGAYSSQFAATSKKVEQDRDTYKGAYICPPCKLTPLTGQAADDALAEQLWSLSEEVVKEVEDKGSLKT